MKRRERIFLAIGLLLAVVVAYSYGSFRIWRASVVDEVEETLANVVDYRPESTCYVYDKNGDVLDSFYIEQREWLPIEEMPDILWESVVASEDRRFMSHDGVDPIGIARAMVANAQSGSIQEGGSTLTQQLVKNLFLTSTRSYERKAREAVIALEVEKRLDKMQILELYLNYVYLGSGNYGVEAAAQDYFGISARDVDAAQAALLASLIPAPSTTNPLRNPDVARRKRSIALDDLVEVGRLTQAEADAFKLTPIINERRPDPSAPAHTAYATVVRREVRRLLGETLPFQLGLDVYTPFDPELQQAVDAAVEAGTRAVAERQGAWGVRRQLESEEEIRELAELPFTAPPESGECFEAVLQADRKFARGGQTFELPRWQWSTRVAEYSDRWITLGHVARTGAVFSMCLDEDGNLKLDDGPWAQAAVVVIENATGHVVALSGGRDVPLQGFVRATQARRQPGSTFKPFVYATALQSGDSQLSTVMDTPLYFPGSSWSPASPSGYHGEVTYRNALRGSYNIPPVRLAFKHGVSDVSDTAKRLGVASPLRGDLTLALGSSEVTPMDMATAYSTIARGGDHIDPVFITRLVDVDGHEIGVSGGPVLAGGRRVGALPGQRTPVLDPGVAAELADMLHHVVEAGTGRRARTDRHWLAGKTGTTNLATDTWFVGFDKQYTIAVWVGTDDFTPLGKHGEGGSRSALPIFADIMAALPESSDPPALPDQAIAVPTWAGWVTLDRRHAPPSALRFRVPGDAPLAPFSVQLGAR